DSPAGAAPHRASAAAGTVWSPAPSPPGGAAIAAARPTPGSGVPEPGRAELLGLYETMMRIRRFEERVYFLFLEGGMPGTIHLYIGEEAIAAGVCAVLRRDDHVTSTHRPHGHAI